MAHAMYPGLSQPHPMEMEYWSNIDKLHLSYLHAEESPQKIAEKERLENVIRGFLGRIPHNRKFLIPITAQIFQRSITEVQDFSIVKLSTAWTVIGLYAQNLITQPWRKEFHKIQMFSGYYEHNVRNILVGGEQMLIYMGYKVMGDGVMYLDGPVDPDRVALVSKDCFIASTECQVMFQIYKEMIGRSNNVSYEDIFHFREENICDTNKAIFELSSPHYRPLSMYSTMGHPYAACSKTLSQRSSYMKDSMNPHYQWHDGHYLPNEGPNYGTMIPPNPHLPPHYFYPTNGCSYPPTPRAYYSSGASLHHAVPTAQLIELESSHSKNYVNEKAHRRNGSEPSKHDCGHRVNEDELDYPHSKEIVRNWLYYDELANERKELARKVCEEMVKVNLSDPPLDTKSAKRKERKPSKESLVRPISLRSTSTYEQVEKPPSQKTTKSKTNATPNVDGSVWECLSCTYHNRVNVDVCEMCDKSRIQGNEVLPLASGGRECHKCTLVNERGEEKCRACGECLKDSPTYI